MMFCYTLVNLAGKELYNLLFSGIFKLHRGFHASINLIIYVLELSLFGRHVHELFVHQKLVYLNMCYYSCVVTVLSILNECLF